MYQVGDKIAHPMHGAGVVSELVEQSIDGVSRSYYVLKLTTNNMRVMVPTDSCREIGLRPVIDREEAESVLSAIREMDADGETNWNRRYRDNMAHLKSGDLMQVARVVKTLILREQKKGLSTGERKMLSSAKQILISEIVLAKEESYKAVETRIYRLALGDFDET